MKFFLIFAIGFLFFSPELSARDRFVDDASLWLGVNIEKKISKKINLSFSNQTRFDRNFSRYRMGYQDLGFEYRLLKFLNIQGDYKLIHRQLLDESFSIRHQFNLALVLNKNFGLWSMTFRNRWQCQFKDVYSSEDGKIPQWVNRNKLTLKYDFNKRIQGFVSSELNYIFRPVQEAKWDRVRSSAGLEYKITKHSSVELYYTFQRDLEADLETERFHIYGLTYLIKI